MSWRPLAGCAPPNNGFSMVGAWFDNVQTHGATVIATAFSDAEILLMLPCKEEHEVNEDAMISEMTCILRREVKRDYAKGEGIGTARRRLQA